MIIRILLSHFLIIKLTHRLRKNTGIMVIKLQLHFADTIQYFEFVFNSYLSLCFLILNYFTLLTFPILSCWLSIIIFRTKKQSHKSLDKYKKYSMYSIRFLYTFRWGPRLLNYPLRFCWKCCQNHMSENSTKMSCPIVSVNATLQLTSPVTYSNFMS